jgi:MIP family channel proteins
MSAVPAEKPDPRGPAAYVAEIVGTFLLVFFVCGVITVGAAPKGPALDLAGLGLLHALILMVLVYALGATSGAHFNPAVTTALWSIRKISTANALVYFVCQAIGAILGALVVSLLFHDLGKGVHFGAATINGDVLQGGAPWRGLIAEALGTFMLMWAVMALAVNPRGNAAFAGLGIGGALGLAVMIFGPATGAGLNPARWLGPAIASGTYTDAWVYILGPVIGAVLAALGYRALVLEARGLPAQRPKDELPG